MSKKRTKYVHSEKVHNLNAPNIIVPYLINKFQPKSVVDVGCGIGTFLKVFSEKGVKKILGIDGEWVVANQLQIKNEEFLRADLEKPLTINDKFDMVLCLEVVEHLKETSSDIIVESLTSLGNIIVFSSAIVNQGGQNHINEQDYYYWQEKFSKKGYYYYDLFRNQFWNNSSVDWWYKQNMFLVAHESVNFDESINRYKVETAANVYVHPDKFNLLKEEMDNMRNGGYPISDYLIGVFKKVTRLFNRRRKSGWEDHK